MRVFVIHRFDARETAIRALRALAKHKGISIRLKLLDSSHGDIWRQEAATEIDKCEVVIIYDQARCNESENATWELNKAKDLKKPVISIDPNAPCEDEIDRLCAIYHHNEEFNSLFSLNGGDVGSLYKMMVDSSESLVQRRQTMNAFFITAIGGLLAIAGALEKFGKTDSTLASFLLMASFGIAGMFLCNSWRNLIDNYGKLNAAKFRVILKLEKSLPAQVFAAEWAALGKGLRPQKYKSFTSTENMVPLWFAFLIFGLLMGACAWRIWS